MIVINPGSGPVPQTTEEEATKNIGIFMDDLIRRGVSDICISRKKDLDYGDGRYAFELRLFRDGQAYTVEVQMPGLPLECVRWMDEPGQNIWDFPRLYIDGSSWVWKFALNASERPFGQE